MDLLQRLPGLPGLKRRDPGPRSESSGDSLVIDCRGCSLAPDPGSAECIGCMVDLMCQTGGAERIVLRTGRDIEVSGPAGRALKEIASLKRWSIPAEKERGLCRTCPLSRRLVLERAWGRFPGPMTDGLREEVAAGIPEKEGCDECAEATIRALDGLDRGLRDILDEMTGGGMRWTSPPSRGDSATARSPGKVRTRSPTRSLKI